MCVLERHLLMIGLAGVDEAERPLPSHFLSDRVDGGVDPRLIIAKLLNGIVATTTPRSRPAGGKTPMPTAAIDRMRGFHPIPHAIPHDIDSECGDETLGLSCGLAFFNCFKGQTRGPSPQRRLSWSFRRRPRFLRHGPTRRACRYPGRSALRGPRALATWESGDGTGMYRSMASPSPNSTCSGVRLAPGCSS